jgi:hypothetical protein
MLKTVRCVSPTPTPDTPSALDAERTDRSGKDEDSNVSSSSNISSARKPRTRESVPLKPILKSCLAVLKTLMSEPFVTRGGFASPVDVSKYPTYPLVVANPIDLGTVRSRFYDGTYALAENEEKGEGRDAFMSDVSRVFDNARLFNAAPTNQWHIWANEGEAKFRELMSRIQPGSAPRSSRPSVQRASFSPPSSPERAPRRKRSKVEVKAAEPTEFEKQCAELQSEIDRLKKEDAQRKKKQLQMEKRREQARERRAKARHDKQKEEEDEEEEEEEDGQTASASDSVRQKLYDFFIQSQSKLGPLFTGKMSEIMRSWGSSDPDNRIENDETLHLNVLTLSNERCEELMALINSCPL